MFDSIEARREAIRDDVRRREGGFTLVELLVVIAVLAILTAVAVFAVGGITDRGNEAACEATTDSVRVAVEAYRAQNNSIPTITQLTSGGWLEVDDDLTAGTSTITKSGTGGWTVTLESDGDVVNNCVSASGTSSSAN